MHNRKFFLRFVGPGDEVDAEVVAEELVRFQTGKTISIKPRKVKVRAVYERRGGAPGDHVVNVGSLGILVHSKNLFEVEGWKMKAPPEEVATTTVAQLGEPQTTDYCVACGDSPESGNHLPSGHAYVDPRITKFGPRPTTPCVHEHLSADVVDELYLAMKARRDRFMKSRRTPIPETMAKAFRTIAKLAGKSAKV